MKTIWFFCNSEPNFLDGKNIKLRRHGQLINYLSKRNIRIIWWSSNFSHFHKKVRNKKDILIKVKKNIYIMNTKSISYKTNISIRRYLNTLFAGLSMKKYFYTLKKPDLIILSVPPVDSAASFVNFAKKNKIPLISDFRDMWPDIINHNLNWFLKIFFYPFYLYMYLNLLKIRNNSNYIVSVSNGMLKWIKNKSNKIIPSSVIYLYHDIPKIKNKKVNNIIYFYYAGVISTSNYMQKFLKYFDNLPSKLKQKIKINISGYGDVYNNLSSNSKRENVKFLGWLDQKEIAWFSNKSHYGLVTYKNRFDFKRNIPNKISEYLGYGMPVLTTLKGESFNIMKFYSTCIYINLKNQKSFENSMLKIIKNKNYRKMSQNSRKLFLKKFDSKKNLENYFKIIKRFI